jgi:large subunit ribosomal protein L24e
MRLQITDRVIFLDI